ncbi:MAG: zinc ABC transporter substrate-binding protein [Burkholderiales bacterium]|nr:zinc ABC transporter substrate-binding protein [Burkholderiales bacterium]
MPRSHSVPRLAAIIIGGIVLLAHAAFAHTQPRVVASIVSIHSLVAGVMDGIGVPELLLRGAGSPHTYSLRPSEARALNQAGVVFWIGPAFESFMRKPLTALSKKARIVELGRIPDVTVLPAREGGNWGDHAHGKSDAAETDWHLFLDPDNAKAIVRAAVLALSEADTTNQARYAANGETMIKRLDALDVELRQSLAPVRGKPFVVFHDAYQYFERRYGLNAVGSITVSPERAPGAQRLQRLRKQITDLKAVCVFSEPQFASTVVRTVIERTPANTGVLDPLGATVTPGPTAYFDMMRARARSLTTCLSG